MKLVTRIVACFSIALLFLSTSNIRADSAADILSQSGFTGGLIVHVGCGDGQLTAALGEDPTAIVQGLSRDAAQVERARQTIQAAGRYGRVSVSQWQGPVLPYADNLVNLLVIEDDAGKVSAEEIDRVLAPRGIAMIENDGQWSKRVKAWPEALAPWTHYLYNASGNAVSKDKAVGPPRHIQWVDGPMYAHSHETNSSMAAMVSASGRVFYIWNEAMTGLTDPRMPERWSLIARDAFNGSVLWKIPLKDWGWSEWHGLWRWDDPRERAKMLRVAPATLPRRLVATDDRLYVTLGYKSPVSILDTATGEMLGTIEGSDLADEIICEDNLLLLRVRDKESPPEDDVWYNVPVQEGRIVAVDTRTAQTKWQGKREAIAAQSLAACGSSVYYTTYRDLVCLDRATGKERWRSKLQEAPRVGSKGRDGTLIALEDVVLIKKGNLRSFDAATGKELWTTSSYGGMDLFVADGLVWTEVEINPRDKKDYSITDVRREGRDLRTGEIVRKISVPKLMSPGHHFRCYRSKATERFLLLPKRGIEFLDLTGDEHMRTDWLRPPCVYGTMPANGLLYVAPHQCVCYQGVLMSNFNALSASSSQPPIETPQTPLIQGEAWGTTAGETVDPTDWPIYRRDPQRSGYGRTSLPDRPQPQWEVSLQAPVTPPVSAAGRVIVAEKDTHDVVALDGASGKVLWRFTAGGRVDSPPTIFGSTVLFGSTDGWIYCVTADEGRLVWQRRLAPTARKIVSYGQLESAWPVHGSVIVQEDANQRPVVYATAGRSSFLDGGIFIYGLDPATGEILYRNRLDGPHPDPMTDRGMAGYGNGAKSDLLVSDGGDLFLFQERFGSDLTRHPAPLQKFEKEYGGYRVYPPAPERGSTGRRLYTTGSFFDDTLNEGTYWGCNNRWPGWDRHMGSTPMFGRIASFDDDTIYVARRMTDKVRVRRGFIPGGKGCSLFARDLVPPSTIDPRKVPNHWQLNVPILVRAMTTGNEKLIVAGPPDVVPEDDPAAAYDGRIGSLLWTVSKKDGTVIDRQKLDDVPVFDGVIAVDGRLIMSCTEGKVRCFGE